MAFFCHIKPRLTLATRLIIAEAMQDDTKLLLFYTTGARLTDADLDRRYGTS